MRKRMLAMLIAGCLAVSLTACGSSNEITADSSTAESAVSGSASPSGSASGSAETTETPEVKKNLLSVEITIPADAIEDVDQTLKDAEDSGYKATANDDGSITYKLSKTQHKQLLAEVDQAITESIDELIEEGDFPSLKSISFNGDYTKAKVVVDYAAFDGSFDVMALYTVAFAGPMYQIYNGVDQNDLYMDISIIDEASNEVKETMVFPDDFADSETES